MTHVNIPALAQRVHPVVQIQNGQPITTSVEVARVFERRHDDVLKAIRKLLSDLDGEGVRNFAETPYTNPQNGQTYPAYHLTRDGFTLLAFGFTGKKAMAFKLAYIDAFNQMEAQLTRNTDELPAPRQQELTMTDSLSNTGITPDMISDIVASTTQNLVATLQQKRRLIAWPDVIEALQNPKTDMAFADLAALLHAAIARLQRNINAEAYTAIARRAANRNQSTAHVAVNV